MSEPKAADQPRATRPATIGMLRIVVLAVAVASVAADAFVERHGKFGFDGSVGFQAWYGLISCVGLYAVARAVGLLLARPGRYYDR